MKEKQFEVIKGADFYKYLDRVIQIDTVTLPEKYVTGIDKLKERYEANKDSFIGVLDNKELIGYFNFFPINGKTLNKIVSGELVNDIFLGSDDVIPYTKENPIDIYIITVAVLPAWQNRTVISILQDEFKKFIHEKYDQNYKIRKLYASAVSDDGEKLLKRMSFVSLEENSSCYSTTIERFLSE